MRTHGINKPKQYSKASVTVSEKPTEDKVALEFEAKAEPQFVGSVPQL
jgi:hypothetical protein